MKPTDSNNSSRCSTLSRQSNYSKPLVTISTYEERQEELKKTMIMRDETDHRSPPPPPPPQQQQNTNVTNHKSTCSMINGNVNGHQVTNGHHHHHQLQHSAFENGLNTVNGNHKGMNGTNDQLATPPPPPQFANKSAMGKKVIASINAFNAAHNHNNNNYHNGHNDIYRNGLQNYHMNNTDVPPNVPPPPPPPPLPESPIPDFDSTMSSPAHTMTKEQTNNLKHAMGCNGNMSTLGRVAASETAKANGDMAELESIDSYQMLNPASPTPKPPSSYFVPPNSGPPTMKKSNRPVSVTIGEYGASKSGGRREPSKFDFIASRSGSNSPNDLGSPMTPMSPISNGKDENVTHMLRSELELTLSRSNLKKRHDHNGVNGNTVVQFNNGIYQNGNFQHNSFEKNNSDNYHAVNNSNGHLNGCTKIQNGAANRNIAYQSNMPHMTPTKSYKQPLSSNVEKITNMLQNMNSNGIYESSATLNASDKTAASANATRVTISLANNNSKMDIKKTESNNMMNAPSNGILKNSIHSSTNGTPRNSSSDKSISFGN